MPISRHIDGSLAVIAALLPTVLTAQAVNQAHAWASIFAEHRIAPKTHFYWELSLRRHDLGLSWQQQLGAFGVSRDLSATYRGTASLGWSNTYRYGATPVRSKGFELRPWVQVVGTHRLGRPTWVERTRLELRNVQAYGDLAPPDPAWVSTWRVRRQDRLAVPLRTNSAWYAAAAQEWFVLLGPNRGASNRLEQTRTQLLLGRQLSPVLRVEGGYMLQAFWRRTTDELDHTALVVFRTTAPIVR